MSEKAATKGSPFDKLPPTLIKKNNVTLIPEGAIGYLVGPTLALLANSVLSNYFNKYMSDVLHINTWASAFFTWLPVISVIFVVIGNVLVGQLMDRNHSRNGKARPLLIVSVPISLLALLFLFVFSPYNSTSTQWHTGALICIAIGYNLWFAFAYPMYYTPHAALVSLSTRNSKDRSLLATLSNATMLAAMGLSSMILPFFLNLLFVYDMSGTGTPVMNDAGKIQYYIDETGAAIHRNRELLKSISAERIFSELKGLLLGRDAGRLLLDYSDVVFTVLPELAPMAGFDQHSPHHDADLWTHTCRAVDYGPRDATLRLALLLHDCGKPRTLTLDETGQGHFYGHETAGAELADGCLRRLRCDNETRLSVVELVRWHDTPIPTERKPLRRRVSRLGPERVRQLVELRRADVLAQASEGQAEKLARLDKAQAALETLLEEETCFSLKDLAVNGRDLIAQGFQAGPALGTMLQSLLDAVLDEQVENSRDALLAWAKALDKPQKGD